MWFTRENSGSSQETSTLRRDACKRKSGGSLQVLSLQHSSPEKHTSPAKRRRDANRVAARTLLKNLHELAEVRAKRIREYMDEVRYIESRCLQVVEESAFHDQGNNSPHASPGEDVATVESAFIGIEVGTVLRDPKLRHLDPVLRRDLPSHPVRGSTSCDHLEAAAFQRPRRGRQDFNTRTLD